MNGFLGTREANTNGRWWRRCGRRFRDTDAMGHIINNAVYVTYLEVARREYWRAFPERRELPRRCRSSSRAWRWTSLRALMHETLGLCIRCSFIGGKSFGFDYEIREQKAAARREGDRRYRCGFYDYAARRAFPCPPRCARFRSFEGTRARADPRYAASFTRNCRRAPAARANAR